MLATIFLMLLNFAVGFITLLLLARFFMQWQRVPFRNPVGQLVLTLTDWVVLPLRRVIPGLLGLDMASLLPAWVLQMLLVWVERAVYGVMPNGVLWSVALGLICLGLIELVRMVVILVMVVVLLSAVLSWINPHAPMASVLYRLAEPFLRPFRRVIPPIASIDLSPLVLLLILQIALVVLSSIAAEFIPLLYR